MGTSNRSMKRHRQVTIRISQDEFDQLESVCEELETSKSIYVREAAKMRLDGKQLASTGARVVSALESIAKSLSEANKEHPYG